jgi:hypothetical protein
MITDKLARGLKKLTQTGKTLAAGPRPMAKWVRKDWHFDKPNPFTAALAKHCDARSGA